MPVLAADADVLAAHAPAAVLVKVLPVVPAILLSWLLMRLHLLLRFLLSPSGACSCGC